MYCSSTTLSCLFKTLSCLFKTALTIPVLKVNILQHGHLAQLGAHILDVDGVRGSNPLVPRAKSL